MADSSSSSSSISGSSLIWVGITLGIVSVFVRPETILCHAKRIVTITVDENENENETATVTSTARTAATTTTTARRSFVYGIVLGLVYGLGVCVFTVFMALLFSPSFHRKPGGSPFSLLALTPLIYRILFTFFGFFLVALGIYMFLWAKEQLQLNRHRSTSNDANNTNNTNRMMTIPLLANLDMDSDNLDENGDGDGNGDGNGNDDGSYSRIQAFIDYVGVSGLCFGYIPLAILVNNNDTSSDLMYLGSFVSASTLTIGIYICFYASNLKEEDSSRFHFETYMHMCSGVIVVLFGVTLIALSWLPTNTITIQSPFMNHNL